MERFPYEQLKSRLQSGLDQLNLQLSSELKDLFLNYLRLIHKWNKAYNLTAIRQPEAMLDLHLLDSLAIVPLVKQLSPGNRLIDVGTGAGLPGVVLAIVDPSLEISLLDTNGKKCRFLNQVRIELGLENIQVIQNRVENYQPVKLFDLVLSRAFATLKDITDNAAHLLSNNGRFLAMKGRYPEQELEELSPQFLFEKAYPLQIPGLDVERYLINIVHREHQ